MIVKALNGKVGVVIVQRFKSFAQLVDNPVYKLPSDCALDAILWQPGRYQLFHKYLYGVSYSLQAYFKEVWEPPFRINNF